ncbi:MAG TPA: hypothetical protein VFF63_04500 [Candidatus Babeliales bacterium]|nr:hypothetical protein [Candidatus Babeliales bacterium]
MPTIDNHTPVSVLRLIEVHPSGFNRLYREIAQFVEGPGRDVSGLIDAQLFGSVDGTRIAILAHFYRHEDWMHARWDLRLGEMLERMPGCRPVDFNLYREHRETLAAAV